MIKMILDQRLLGLRNGPFDRMELLGNVEAGSARLDHFDDPAQMPLGAFEPLDDLRVCFVKMGFHGH
jgi:hypothetical protein